MRIIGFPKLISNEETSRRLLKDCSLVIDGTNHLYYKYETSRLPFVFGTECNEYAKLLRQTLKKFKQANVECFILFKGGNRDLAKLILSIKPLDFDIVNNYTYVPPLYLREIFTEILKEYDIKFTTCVMESKDDSIALASALKCAVLTRNISYCFTRVPYINLTTLKETSNLNNIECEQFELSQFIRKYSLTEKKVAIFVTLSDTDLFDFRYFDRLLRNWGVKKGNLYFQYKSLVQWLSVHDEDNIITSIINFLRIDSERNKFEEVLEQVLHDIQNEEPGLATEYLLNPNELVVQEYDPLWFEKGIITDFIAVPYINLYKYKYLQGSWVVENKTSEDSLLFSMSIIVYAYNLLTNYKSATLMVLKNGNNFINVPTDKYIIKKPKYKCKRSVFENGWKDIKQIKLFEHFMTENNIDTEIINKFPVDSRMLFITLIYFARKQTTGVDVSNHIYCFIISYVMLHHVLDDSAFSDQEKCQLCAQDMTEAVNVTKQYFKTDREEETQIYDDEQLKTLVELHYCLIHMNYLNTLCGSPYKPTIYHKTINGTFIYKLVHDMKFKNAKGFIESLFQTAPTVYKYIDMLITTYNNIL